ncbi:hypothetical protein HQ393_07800 [Chitinibacter bivalviorum]|uniref:Uncharacterized protein n=1 Tax=Chitinibacter bivalviorum TaxID=2739434 RepID=A0A7H9BHQ7_9NEIS|nr:hypothetical protein [Chitinibacter bivalviorum]QLG88167.1 hypothetical protein HQ393_07800 [Chitinibacter bivalviorum]
MTQSTEYQSSWFASFAGYILALSASNGEINMSSISSAMNFSSSLSQTLTQGAQQTARAIGEGSEKLDRKKEQISQQALQDIQAKQAIAQKMDSARNKIDTYA